MTDTWVHTQPPRLGKLLEGKRSQEEEEEEVLTVVTLLVMGLAQVCVGYVAVAQVGDVRVGQRVGQAARVAATSALRG